MNKSELYIRYPELAVCEESVEKLCDMLLECYRKGGKLLLCGNGGSAADCEHIAGELLKGFNYKRPLTPLEKERFGQDGADIAEKLQRGFAAVPLPSLSGIGTAYANDVSSELVFAQEVFSLGRDGDVLLGITTSGNSKNVVAALKTAKALGLSAAALTGENKGAVDDYADVAVHVPSTETYKIQEYHLPVYHYLCGRVEEILFGE